MKINNYTKRIFQNKMLLAKVVFSLYNITIILILNIYFDLKEAGELLYIQGILVLFSSISRLGSDYFWISDETKFIVIAKYEWIILLLSSFFFCFFLYNNITGFGKYSLPLIFSAMLLWNTIALFSRIYQKENRHIESLFMQVLAPTVFIVPIFCFTSLNILLIFNISSLLVIMIMFIFYKPKFNFKYSNTNFFLRLHYMPMKIYGEINQNFISTLAGFLSKEELIPILVLFQKISGLITWPQIFFMQKRMPSILLSIKTTSRFRHYLFMYLKTNIFSMLTYAIGVIIVMTMYMYIQKNLTIVTFASLALIILATIVNASLSHLQLLLGKINKGQNVLIVLILVVVTIYFSSVYVYINEVTLTLFYLYFQLMVHISNYYILSKNLKNA